MFNPFKVVDKIQESRNICSFYLKPTDQKLLPHYLPGQHIIVRLDIPGQTNAVQRSYTLSAAPGQEHYRITVKREGTLSDPGLASSFLHDHIHIGDTIHASEPLGRFTLKTDSPRPVVLVSAGVGITPMLSMLQELASETSDRQVWFFHQSRNTESPPMGHCLREIAEQHSRIKILVYHSQPSDIEVQGFDYDKTGRIDIEAITQHLADQHADFYICGPQGFVQDFSAGLRRWGVPENLICGSYFTHATPVPVSEVKSSPDLHLNTRTVFLTQSAKSLTWDEASGSLLDLLEKHDIFPPSSCREGTCMSCSTPMVSGEVSYDPEPFGEPFEGEILLCCARPQTDIELGI